MMLEVHGHRYRATFPVYLLAPTFTQRTTFHRSGEMTYEDVDPTEYAGAHPLHQPRPGYRRRRSRWLAACGRTISLSIWDEGPINAPRFEQRSGHTHTDPAAHGLRLDQAILFGVPCSQCFPLPRAAV